MEFVKCKIEKCKKNAIEVLRRNVLFLPGVPGKIFFVLPLEE